MEASLLGGKLIFLKKNGKNRVVYTTRGSAVRFGKDLLCHFRLRHPNACKIHCKICIGRIGKVQIINYSTDQSVAVNDKIVVKKQFIKSGDQISILGMNFVWEFTPIVDALKTPVRKSSPLSMRPAEMKRACWSEPGRRKKLKRLNKETIVSILTPVRKRRRFSGVPELKIGVPEDEKTVPEVVEQPKTPEKNLLEGTGIVSPNLPRQSINLMSFQTPKTLRGDNSTAESTMKDSTVVAATIDGSKSLYGTPVGPSLEGTRASPEQPSNLIDLNTPAPTKGYPEKLCADSDASDFFKTPMKQIHARGLKTPSSIAPQTAAKVDFTSLPQSTPIDVTKRLDVNEESTIIDVDQSESVITIDDSSETLKTPENSIKFIGEASIIDDSLATPKRTLRSATKSSVASTKKLPEVNSMTPKTPQITRRNAKTPQSAVSVKKQPQDITPRTSTLPRSTRKSTRTPQSVKKIKNEDLEDFSTPKQIKKIIRRPVTSAKKLKERKIEAKLNTSDTTGEKPQPTVSQLRGLMTMENLTNITSSSDVFDKENMTSPQATTMSEDHQLRSLQKENNMPNMTPTPAKKQLKSLSAVKSGRITKTPRSPLNNLSNISGVKNLFGTQQKSPKAVQRHQVVASSPLNDLTDVGGVRRLFRTPGRGKKDDLTDIVGVRELLATPKSTNKLEDIVGVRELLKTPLEDVTVDLRGVRELMQDLPKDETSVRLAGIRDLMKSPEAEGASPDLRGVRKLLKSPVDQDLSMDLRGIREIMKEPKEADYSVVYAGVKDLMKEPKEGDMSLKFTGVKELMKEPIGDETINYVGLRDIMKPSTSKDTSFAMVGVKELLKEPVDVETTQNLTGMADLYTIPEESKPLSQGEDVEEASKPTSSSTSVVEVIELDATVDQLFDSLKGLTSMPSVQRTYSRKESPKKVKTPEKIEKGGDDKGIQEWIDSIVLSTTNENAHSRRANNTLQVLSDKYSNVTATESEQLLTESIDNNPESEDVAEDNATIDIPSTRKETTGRDMSLRKLAIAQSFAETEKNLLSVNDTFDFGHGVTSTPKTPRLKVYQLTEIAPRRSPRLQRTTEILLKTPEVSSTTVKNEATSANDKPRRGRKPKAVTFAVPESPAAVSSSTSKEIEEKHVRNASKNKKTKEETPESPVRTNRGRKAAAEALDKIASDALDKSTADAESNPSERPRRGRKAATTKQTPEEEENKPTEESSAKAVRSRRGRKPAATKEVHDVKFAEKAENKPSEEAESKPAEEAESQHAEEAEESPAKPVRSRRGRKPAVTKQSRDVKPDEIAEKPTKEVENKPAEEAENKPSEKAEEIPAKPVRSRRGRKPAAVKEAHDVKPAEEAESRSAEVIDEDPAMSIRSRRGRKAQQKPDPTVTNEEEENKSSDDVFASPAQPVRAKRGRKAAATTDVEEQTEKSSETAVESSAKQTRKRGRKVIPTVEEAEETKDVAENAEDSTASTRTRRTRKATAKTGQDSQVNDEDTPAKMTKRTRKAAGERNNNESVTSVESSAATSTKRSRRAATKEDEESNATPAKRTRNPRTKKTSEASAESPVQSKRARRGAKPEETPISEATGADIGESSRLKRTRKGSKVQDDVTEISRKPKNNSPAVVAEQPTKRNLRSRRQ